MPPFRDIHPSTSRLSSYKRSKRPYPTSEERDQSQQIANIVAASDDAIISESLDGIVLSWNRGAEKMFGFSAEEMIGRSILAIFPPERTAELGEILTKIRQGERIDHFETERICKDGSHIPISVSTYGILDLDGKLVRSATIARDLRGRNEMQAQLHGKQQELEIILKGIIDGIVVHDVTGKLVYVNDAAVEMGKFTSIEEMMALPPEELSQLFEFFNEAGERIPLQDLPSSLAIQGTTSKQTLQYSIKRIGERRWTIYSATPIKNAIGETQFVINIFHDITEQRKNQETLQGSKEQLETILRSLRDGITVQDRSGKLVYVNDIAAHLCDFPSGEALRTTPTSKILERYELLSEEGNPFPIANLPTRSALQGKSAEAIIQYRIKRTGDVRWSAVRAEPVLDEQGHVAFAISIIHDITEQRAAQESLKRSEEQYRSLAEAIPAIVFTATPEGVIDYYNQHAYNYAGMSPEELLLGGIGPIIHPDDEKRCQTLWEEAIRSGKTYEIEYQLRRGSDGQYRWHLGRAVALFDEQGKIIKWFGTCTDIDDQKRVEQHIQKVNEDLERRVQERTRELNAVNKSLEKEIAVRMRAEEKDKANLQRLQEILDSLPMGAIASDENGVILHMNDQFCALLGLRVPSQDLIGKNQEIIPTMLQNNIQQFDDYTRRRVQMLETRAPLMAEEIVLQDGHVLERDYIPLFVQDVFRGHLALYRDVTQERRIDATKSEFMSLASHQLRTPLTAIRWALGRLERLIDHRSMKKVRLLQEARSAAIRMTETINTMLAISRIEAGKMSLEWTEVSLSSFFDTLREQYEPECAKRGHTLTIRCPASLTLTTDAHFLKEILQNLLNNAVKYTPDQGSISMSAKVQGHDVCITVIDTGYGIPSHQHERIFTKFFRGDNIVDKETDGTGLGLYLVYLLSRILGGTVSFDSTENEGTTFRLLLPKE